MHHNKTKIESIIVRLSYRQTIRTVFTDVLDIIIYSLTINDKASLVNSNSLEKYDEKERKLFAELLKLISESMDDYFDILGDIFMEHLSFGRNGQFFTPPEICDMMAQMTYLNNPIQSDKITTVMDCACGSGRTLLSAAKINRNQIFYGSDIDITCVKMAVVNLSLNSLKGEIHWMNTISMEHYGSFCIHVEPITRLPYIITLPADKSLSVNAVKNAAQNMPDHQRKLVQSQAKQLNLFDDM